MPCIDLFNEFFDAIRSTLLYEVTNMIFSACGIILSTKLREKVIYGNGCDVHFRDNSIKRKHVNEANQECAVEFRFP